MNGDTTGTATLNKGSVELPLAGLAVGTHTITARFLGDANHGLSETVVSRVIAKADTTTSVSAQPTGVPQGKPITFVATLGELHEKVPAGGTVQFSSNGQKVGKPVTVRNGEASLTVTDLSIGTNAVAATYSGDDNYESSTSISTEVTIDAKPSPPGQQTAANGNQSATNGPNSATSGGTAAGASAAPTGGPGGTTGDPQGPKHELARSGSPTNGLLAGAFTLLGLGLAVFGLARRRHLTRE